MRRLSITHGNRWWAGVAGLALLVQLAGCGVGQEIADPVDPELAQRTLRDVLDAWAAGTRPEELRQKTPEVVVQDFDWSAGSRLVSFEVKAPGSPQDANLFCDVKLVLEDASRRKVERLVTYCVGTDPVLTVFRAPGS